MPCPLIEVRKTAVLKTRVNRAPNLTAENEAFHRLSRGLLRPPLEQLQDLLEVAMKLCNAGSAGVSLLDEEEGQPVFRWVALAGRYRNYVGGTLPRVGSPCSVTLESGTPELFVNPGFHFLCLANAEPAIVEGLVVPIQGGDQPDPGTIWVVSHNPKSEFDMEDVRVLSSLAGFAGFSARQLVAARAEGGCPARN